MKNKIPFVVVPILFVVFNLITPFFLTSDFNEVFLGFNLSFLEIVLSVLGNLSILLILVLLISQINNTKIKTYLYCFSTFVLSMLLTLINYFNFYFACSPNLLILKMMDNPTGGYSFDIFIQYFRFVGTHIIVLVFIPFFVFVGILIFGIKEKTTKSIFFKKIKGIVISLIVIFSLIFVSFYSFSTNMKKYNLSNNTLPSYAIQEMGAYNYYLFEFLSVIPTTPPNDRLGIENDEDFYNILQEFNKNSSAYNGIDGITYSNRFEINDVMDDIYVAKKLINDTPFKGYNLVLVQLESFNNFLVENKNIKTHMPFLSALFNESVVFDNFYTSIGVGTSSDTELTVLTGLYPLGPIALPLTSWASSLTLNTLPKLFKNENYKTISTHGDVSEFYNRGSFYPDTYGFDSFYSIDDFTKDYELEYDKLTNKYSYEYEDGKIHTSPWISDYLLFTDIVNKGEDYLQKDENFFMFPITLMPHTPFNFNPDPLSFPEYNKADYLTKKYISFAQYYDDTIKRLFINEKGESTTLPNTVYLFYGDHGSALRDSGLDLLFEDNLSTIRKREILQKTVCFMYVPNVSPQSVKYYNGIKIYEGLMRGNQPYVRSTIDIFKTLVDLFGLDVGTNPYFGVNMLTREKTYAFESRNYDVITDFYVHNLLNSETYFYDGETNIKVDQELMDNIYKFKLFCEYVLSDEKNMEQLLKDYSYLQD
jgi:phosphoglycerol transferase MdoB-like AlkP superfamily enzyme